MANNETATDKVSGAVMKKRLNAFVKAIIDEAEQNDAFAEKIIAALNWQKKPAKNAAKTVKAVLNPVQMIMDGESSLEEKLYALDEKQLKGIIAEYALDPTRVSSRWHKKERLVALIMDMSEQRANKGDVFK